MFKRMPVIMMAISCALLCGCTIVDSFKHDGKAVARACGQKLYSAELSRYIPDGVTPDDSAALATLYINSWAKDMVLLKAAESSLSKEEKNVDKELEDYRRSLLRYRYETAYVNQKLNTAISPADIKEYYEAHKQTSFTLQRPVLKVRFVLLMKDSPMREEILEKLPATDQRDLQDLDSLSRMSALRYLDYSSTWTDAAVLAREFATDYETMLKQLKNNYITLENEERGDIRAAYVFEMVEKGPAPLGFCEEQIRESILSARKRDLLTGLEQELLEKAREKKDFIVYDE